MTDRILPPEEWGKVAHLAIGDALPHLDPRWTSIAVVEDEQGQIIGCWAAVLMVHAEGVWIDPAHRKSSVALRLWRRMKAIVSDLGRSSVLTGCDSPEIAALLNRKRAQPLAYQEYVVCL